MECLNIMFLHHPYVCTPSSLHHPSVCTPSQQPPPRDGGIPKNNIHPVPQCPRPHPSPCGRSRILLWWKKKTDSSGIIKFIIRIIHQVHHFIESIIRIIKPSAMVPIRELDYQIIISCGELDYSTNSDRGGLPLVGEGSLLSELVPRHYPSRVMAGGVTTGE
jgi:hypothetical protein